MVVRGEPRTPTSVVSPPWRRENPHTPTYRPPHLENAANMAATSTEKTLRFFDDSQQSFDEAPPPRPKKLTPRNILPAPNATAQFDGSRAAGDFNINSQVNVNPQVNTPTQTRNQLQATQNWMKRRKEPLIFQFPVPYKQPSWLQVAHRCCNPPC